MPKSKKRAAASTPSQKAAKKAKPLSETHKAINAANRRAANDEAAAKVVAAATREPVRLHLVRNSRAPPTPEPTPRARPAQRYMNRPSPVPPPSAQPVQSLEAEEDLLQIAQAAMFGTQPPVDEEVDWFTQVSDRVTQETPEEEEFHYSAKWTAFAVKEIVACESQHLSNSTPLVLYRLNQWIDKELAEQSRTFSARSTRAIASYARCAPADRFERRIKDNFDYSELVAQLKRWRNSGKKELKIDVNIQLKEVVSTGNTTIDLTQSEPAVKRKTATEIHKIAMPHLQAAELDSGLHGSAITSRWSCTVLECANYGHACWYDGAANSAINHYPLKGVDVKDWSEDINKTPLVTPESPPAFLLLRLAKHKVNGKTMPQSSQQASSQQQGNSWLQQQFVAPYYPIVPPQMWQYMQQAQQFYPAPPPLPPPPQVPTPSQAPAPPSQALAAPQAQSIPQETSTASPIHTDTSPDDLIKEFIAWLKPRWKTQDLLLEEIQAKLIAEDFEVDTIQAITEQRWESWHFRPGRLAKLNAEYYRFKSWRINGGIAGVN